MKKVFSLLTIVAMGISMIGCGEEKTKEKTKTTTEKSTETTPPPKTP